MGDHLTRLVDAAARTLSRQSKKAALAAVIELRPDGSRALRWAADEAISEDLEMIALGLLDSVEHAAAHGALTCDGCADRMARARVAIAAIRGEATTRPRHAH